MINFINSQDENGWRSDASVKVREAGLAELPKPPVDTESREQLPAGAGKWVVPAFEQTTGSVNQAFRSYYHLYDNALKHSRQNAIACRNDPVVYQAIREAQTPIAQLGWSIEPNDETNPAEVEAALKITKAISLTPRFQQMLMSLLEGLWYGRAGVQLIYEWNPDDPSMMIVRDWLPLPSDSLIPRWDGTWGMLVGYNYEGETEPYNLGRAVYFSPEQAEAVLIHQSDREAADFYDTTGSGSIAGVGWRSRVFWHWFIKSNILANMLDLVERLGNGVWIAGFDQSNPDGRSSWERALAEYRDKRVLMRPIDRNGNSLYDLTILDPAATTTANLEGLIRYFDGIIRSVILGHPLGAGAEINIGGDPAAIYGDAVTRTTKFHAVNLAETLSYKWLPTLYRYNAPGVAPGRLKFSTDHPNADALLGYAERLGSMGFGVDLDHIADICGVVKAQSGSQIYSKVQNLNPTAVESPPQGVPIAGNTPQPAPAQPVQAPEQQVPALS